MSRPGDEAVEFTGHIKGQTGKCYFFESDFAKPGEADWAVPKSQVIGTPEMIEGQKDDTYVTLTVKKWLADKNGWE